MIFVAEEAPEEDYIAGAARTATVAEADELDGLSARVRHAVRLTPAAFRLHYRHDEVIAARGGGSEGSRSRPGGGVGPIAV